MSNEETKKSAISNFIMKICGLERYAEIKRQMLCDKNDFEPYVAFQRLTRSMSTGITSSNIQRFLSENLIDLDLDRCRNLLAHYDADKDGLLSYKEFLEIVLPKEHPDLRAFVTQRECYDIKEEEYLSYETEAALAILFEKEICIFEDAMTQKEELDNLSLTGHKIVELIDGSDEGNLNFNNLQKYLHDCGLMPYDAEIISFLRRVDRDDDGFITSEELEKFLERFVQTEGIMDSIRRRNKFKPTNESRLKTFSPGRTIVSNKLSMLNPVNNPIPLSGKANKILNEVTNRATVYNQVSMDQNLTLIPKTPVNKTPVKKEYNEQKVIVNKMKENRPYHRIVHQTPKDTEKQKIQIQKELMRHTNTTTSFVQRQPQKTTQEIHQTPAEHQKDDVKSTISHTQSYLNRNQRKDMNLRNMQLSTSNQTYDATGKPHKTRKTVVIKGNAPHAAKTSTQPQPPAPTPTNLQAKARAVKNRSQLAYNRSRDRLYKSKKMMGPKEDKVGHTRISQTTTATMNGAGNNGNGLNTTKQVLKSSHYTQVAPHPTRQVYTKKMTDMGRSQLSVKTQEDRKKSMLSTLTQPVISKKEDRVGTAQQGKFVDNKQANRHRKRDSSKKKNRRKRSSKAEKSSKKKSSNNTRKSASTSEFVEILGGIIEEQRLLEESKRKMCSQQDFLPVEIFKMIDRRQRRKFTFEEFRFFLSQIGVKQTDNRSLINLFSSYDLNQNCLLGQTDLNQMLKPSDPSFDAIFEKTSDEPANISKPTLDLVAESFNRIFTYGENLMKAKAALKDAQIDLNFVFSQLDVQGKGFLEKNDLVQALNQAIPEFSESPLGEVGLLIDRCDAKKEGKVYFKEFYMLFSS